MPRQFPNTRLRRLRNAPWIRNMVTEHRVHPHDLILPVFVCEDHMERSIASMPDVRRLSISELIDKAKQCVELGMQAMALFPVVEESKKTEDAKEAYNKSNLICRAIKTLKEKVPEIGIICDVALDPYTSHGHDGVMKNGRIANDETVALLIKQALILAESGCDVVAPSDMMDGRIGLIRNALEQAGFCEVVIISYSAKYASAFYGPFRDAVGSNHALKGDKKTYQMNPANAAEALEEIALDIEEGADIILVKPALPYLDIIAKAKTEFNLPIFAYQVSGEYSMIKAASKQHMLDESQSFYESIVSCKRAGACAIFTYAACEIAARLSAFSQK